MNKAIIVARKEATSLLYSGKWLVIWFCFLIISGAFFYLYLDSFQNIRASVQSGVKPPSFVQFINAWVSILPMSFLFVVPSLTMSIYSDEYQQNTLDMLVSSPIKAEDVTCGKFYSLVFSSFLLVSSLLPFLAYSCWLGSRDFGVMFSCVLGILFLLNFQLSISLFLSTFSNRAINNFLIIFTALLGLAFVGQIGWVVRDVPWLSDLCSYLSWSSHTSSFFAGRISSKDIGFFVCFTLFFLYLTFLRTKKILKVSYD